jgi:xanthine dehydrogenase YagS FAD-binding subunit
MGSQKPLFDCSIAGVAAVVAIENGKVTHARLALSGAAPISWHATDAEKALLDSKLDEPLAIKAAELVVKNNMPRADNSYKVP